MLDGEKTGNGIGMWMRGAADSELIIEDIEFSDETDEALDIEDVEIVGGSGVFDKRRI